MPLLRRERIFVHLGTCTPRSAIAICALGWLGYVGVRESGCLCLLSTVIVRPRSECRYSSRFSHTRAEQSISLQFINDF